MSNKILSTLNIGNNSYEIDDAFARQKIEEVDNNLLKINPVYSTSGSVVSFNDGADNLPLDELIVDINPVQDLHGYDHPWIGGSGKNLFENKFVTSTINGITATVDEEGIITLNGTATGNVVFDIMADTITLPSKDSYIVSGGADGGGTDTYRLYFEYYNYTNEMWNGLTCTSADSERPVTTDQFRNFKIQVFNGVTCNNTVFKPMLRKATETDATFKPYENICPITGWTGINVQRCGKNLWNKQLIQGYVLIDNLVVGKKYTATAKMISPNSTTYFYIMRALKGTDIKILVGYVIAGADLYVCTFTVEEGYNYYAFSNNSYTNVTDIQIEEGTIATDYESYISTEVPISWESEAGTVYGGNLNVLTGVLTVDRAIVDIDNLTKNGYSGYGGFYYQDNTFSVNTNNCTCVSCNLLPVKNSHNSKTLGVYCAGNTVYFEGINVTGFANTLAECTEWLKQSNVELILPLTEPITYQLTPHEVKTLLGQNNIFTDINSKNILVSYKASILKYIDRAKSTIFFGQCDPTSTATEFTAQIDGITEYFDGLTILLKNGVVASATGCTININGLGGKGMWTSYELARVSTAFNVTRIFVFIYDSALDDGNGGFWMYQGKDTNDNTVGYLLRTNSTSLPVSSVTYRYRILFTSADKTHYVPANNSTSINATAIRDVNQEKIDPFGKIVYYSSTTVLQAETRPATAGHWLQNTFSLGYSFNRTGTALTLTPWKPVYVKATPYVDGSAIIDADEPITQDLPTTEDGKIYIHLANAYSATNVELSLNHPIYYYYNGAIRPWLGFTDSEHAQDIVSSVNGKTGTVTLTAEDVGAMEGMTILSYGHSTWAEYVEAFNANRVVYCKASANSDPSTGDQSRMAFLAYFHFKGNGYSSDRAEFQYYRSVSTHTNAQQGDQVFCYVLTSTNGGTWSVETRQASSRVIAGTGLASTYTQDNLTLSLDADYKNKIDALWTDYQSALIALDGGE